MSEIPVEDTIRSGVRKVLEDALGCPVMFGLNVYYGDQKKIVIGDQE